MAFWHNDKTGLGRNRRGMSIAPGDTFRRVLRDHTVETVHVVSVAPDQVGIPHVRFRIQFARAAEKLFEDGHRVLALESFARNYAGGPAA
jgi:hypothetical protein